MKRLYTDVGYASNKILALGNPKCDASINIYRAKNNVPDEWLNKTYGKKVFLYNTSIAHFLSSENDLDLLEMNFYEIIENPLNVLLWRPHPLLEATILSMRPNLYNKYVRIKEKLVNHNNFIIDENADSYPAIFISDALISDISSIMFQFGLTGKPVLSVDLDYTYYEKDMYVYNNIDLRYFYFLCGWNLPENRKYNMDEEPSPNGMSISEFVKMVINNEDPKKEKRIMALKNSLYNSDGSAGKKVHNEIMNRVFNNDSL